MQTLAPEAPAASLTAGSPASDLNAAEELGGGQGVNPGQLRQVLEGSAAAQRESQLAFTEFQTQTQLQNLLFEALREAINLIETLVEALFDELEKYRSNISSQQA